MITRTRALLLSLPLLVACGGSSGGGGGGGGSTTAPATSGTTGGATNVASVESVRLPAGGLVAGDVPLAFAIAHPTSDPTDVDVTWSQDGGLTWSVATPGSGSCGLVALPTAPAPGLEYVFVWDSAADVPGFAPDVRLRVTASGGSARETASVAVDNQPLSTHVALTRWPYLQMPVAGEAVVAWRTASATDSVIEWGPTPALGNTSGDPQASTEEHWVTLPGLQAGARYYYRVLSGGLPITARDSFGTAPPANVAALKFVVVGDSGTGTPEQYAVAQQMASEPAEFMLHTGDIVYPAGGFPAAIGEYNTRFFDPYRPLLGHMFSFPVVGNHDLYGLFGQPYKQTFAVPSNGGGLLGLFDELYFSFEWGDAKFIALETNSLWKLLPSGPHVTWLQNELATNQRKWLIVYFHTPLYSCGQHGDSATLIARLEPLFEQYKVDLVLTGHDHDYERTVPIKQFNTDPTYPGLVHVVTGGGGAALRPVNPNARTARALSVLHYLRVSIQGDWLTAEAVDDGGQVIDSFQVRDQ